MPDWQERITSETPPALRAEHALRYRLAAPVVRESALWCDLGCGTGVAAAEGLNGAQPAGKAVLVDVAEDVLAEAEARVPAERVATLAADLCSTEDLDRLRAELLRDEADLGSGGRSVTCFEVIEHLATFVPLLELLVELSEQHGFTVVLSVPNDAFWAIENPFHQTMWGEGAFEELRRLLPDQCSIAHQVALHGSAVAPGRDDGEPVRYDVDVTVVPGGVPTHFLAAFGPDARRLGGVAEARQTDLDEQRRWERQRTNSLAFAEARIAALEDEVRRLEGQLRERRPEPPVGTVEAGHTATLPPADGSGAA